MAKAPGTPEQRNPYLQTLNERTLPYLAADVLFHVLNHRNVRVTDGPGDGKRDIHSETEYEERCVSQCKFHKSTKQTVTSSETDELITALLKFGVKRGFFFTNARISPQAKREYLDSYPGFTLMFFDGSDLMDTLLGTPLLSAIWLHDRSIVAPVLCWALPFILRTVSDDSQLELNDLSPLKAESVQTIMLARTVVDASRFHPYRPPEARPWNEVYNDATHCYEAKVTTETSMVLRFPDQLMLAICEQLTERLPAESVVAVRFGTPQLEEVSGAATEQHRSTILELHKNVPRSYILSKGQRVSDESDWIRAPEAGPRWQFPEHLSMLDAEWCAWINREKEIALEVRVYWPKFNEGSLSQHQTTLLKKKYLAKSLFAEGLADDCQAFCELLEEHQRPNWSCKHGPGGTLLGWLHPGYAIASNLVGRLLRPRAGMREMELFEEPSEAKFQQTISQVKEHLLFGFSLVDWEKAVAISDLTEASLIPRDTHQHSATADLAHHFHEIPSPVYTGQRYVHFVQMWELPDERQMTPVGNMPARPILSPHADSLKIRFLINVQTGRESGRRYLGTCIELCVPRAWPTAKAVDLFIRDSLHAALDSVSDAVNKDWPGAKLATIRFWRDEVGFTIDDTQYRGNPWIGSHELDLSTGKYLFRKRRADTLAEADAIFRKIGHHSSVSKHLDGDGEAPVGGRQPISIVFKPFKPSAEEVRGNKTARSHRRRRKPAKGPD